MRDPLFHHARSCLVVIDVQDYFLNKLPEAERAPLVARIAWLMRVAGALDIPIVATAEDIPQDGPLVEALSGLLPAGRKVFDKRIFGLMDQPDIAAAVAATGRSEFVLAGLETDVCVAHSALGLLAAGHKVAAVEDACASPGANHGAGIARMRGAGVVVTQAKGIFYEWVRDLAVHARVLAAIGRETPPGVTL
ncbi:MAG TPA: isochorismatase family protein [Dongiaceae bacterium]|jgi:nicotinamidase-related amidase|nr:isochorismatase family protein [Dongiaceae bacterium]